MNKDAALQTTGWSAQHPSFTDSSSRPTSFQLLVLPISPASVGRNAARPLCGRADAARALGTRRVARRCTRLHPRCAGLLSQAAPRDNARLNVDAQELSVDAARDARGSYTLLGRANRCSPSRAPHHTVHLNKLSALVPESIGFLTARFRPRPPDVISVWFCTSWMAAFCFRERAAAKSAENPTARQSCAVSRAASASQRLLPCSRAQSDAHATHNAGAHMKNAYDEITYPRWLTQLHT